MDRRSLIKNAGLAGVLAAALPGLVTLPGFEILALLGLALVALQFVARSQFLFAGNGCLGLGAFLRDLFRCLRLLHLPKYMVIPDLPVHVHGWTQ